MTAVIDPYTQEVWNPDRLEVIHGTTVAYRPIQWVIPEWIPEGSLVLLAGREGLGKSTVACKIAADITRGALENSAYTEPRAILYLHSEDSRSLTVAPRLKAAGADMNKVLFLDVRHNQHDRVTLPRDIYELEQIVEDNNVGLIVLDAATSMMGNSGYTSRQVRDYLEPLAALADRQNCVVMGLVHFSKRGGGDSGTAILGSVAWSQVARSVISVAKNPLGQLVIANTKGNLASKRRGMTAIIETVETEMDNGDTVGVGCLKWLGETEEDPMELLADKPPSREVDAWLKTYLSDGPKEAKEVFVGADAAGFSKDQAKRAKRRMGVRALHPGGRGPWFWALPGQTVE